MIFAVFTCYFVAIAAVAYWAWHQTRSMDDFILGGRKLGAFPTALSAGASDMSGWLLLGLPGYAYIAGLEAVWIAIGLLLGTWANWQFVAKRIRLATAHFGNALTLPDYFANRYPQHGTALRLTSALLILLFYVFYTSAGLVAAGKLFETVFNIDYTFAVSLGLLMVVVYTSFGGYLAVSWTDVIQASLMVLALICLPLLAFTTHSPTALAHTIHTSNPALLQPFSNAEGQLLSGISLMSLLAWGLGYFGQPHILSRFMAINSGDSIAKSRRIGVSWTAFSLLGALAIGVIGIALKPELGSDNAETIFMELIALLTHPALAGLLLAAILAAIMSTADSQLLVASSALANDLVKIAKPHTEQSVWLGRGAVVLVATIAWLLALSPDSSVLNLVSYAWAGFGAAFGPAVLLSLYWRKLNGSGVIAAMLAGAITIVMWKNLSGGWFELYEIVPGIVAAGVAAWLATTLTTDRPNT